MIKIPVYDQQSSVDGIGPRVRADGLPIDNSIGNALGNVGRAMGAVSETEARILREQQNATDRLTALKNVSQASLDLTSRVEKMQADAPPGAPGFTKQVLDLVKGYGDDAIKAGGSEYYQREFQTHLIPVSHSLIQGAMRFEADQSRANRLANVDTAIMNSGKVVSINPGAYEDELGRINAMLNTDEGNPFGLSAQQRAAATERARREITNSAVFAWILRDPIGADKALNQTSNPNVLLTPSDDGKPVHVQLNGVDLPINLGTPEEFNHWRNLARSESQRAGVNIRQDLDITYNNQMAMLRNGVMPDAPLSPAAIKSAYAQNPAEGDLKVQNYADAVAMGKNIAAMRMLPSTQLEQYMVAAPDPKAPNYADQERLIQNQASAAKQIILDRNSDFVAWAAKNGIGKVNPINWSDPKSIQAEIPNRLALADLARDWGVSGTELTKGAPREEEKQAGDRSLITRNGSPYPLLSQPEARAFTDYVSKLNGPEKVNLLGAISQSSGPRGMNLLMAQVSKEVPMLAYVGSISGQQTNTGRNIGSLVLEGQDLLKSKQITIPHEADINEDFQKNIGSAIQTDEGRRLAMDATMAIYAKLRYEDGNYRDKTLDNDTFKRAIRLATGGGPLDWNGSNILRPGWGLDDATSRKLLGGVTSDNVKAWGGVAGMDDTKAAEFIRSAPLESIGIGRYRVKAGAGVLHRKDGSVFVMEFR